MQESTANVRKGRQTLCNLLQPNDIYSNELTENHSTSQQKNGSKQKARKNGITSPCTSFDAKNRGNLTNTKLKIIESIQSRPSNGQHWTQTCQKKFQKKTCTTNRSHVGIQTVTTKAPAPNCNYRQHRKTDSNTSTNSHRNNDSIDDCININTNKTDWYIQLASNCYRNGFQLHVNQLDERSKHPCVAPQTKSSPSPTFLRLPSSALLPRAQSTQITANDTVSWIPDLVVCSSLKSIRVAPHCDKTYSSTNTFDERFKTQRHPNQLANHPNRIASKHFTPICDSLYCNRSIDDTIKLPIINTRSIDQPHETKQLNALNAKNNMNSIAIDAKNLHHNLQLLCQANQYNYQNNNLTFNQEINVNGQRDRPTTGSVNNNQNHWIHETNNHHSILLTKQIEVKQTTADHIVSDLIEVFNRSFDITDPNKKTLPQIILSDFSSDQPTPPTTPLFFTVQSERTLPEHPAELQEFQLSKPHQQLSTTNQTNPHLFSDHPF